MAPKPNFEKDVCMKRNFQHFLMLPLHEEFGAMLSVVFRESFSAMFLLLKCPRKERKNSVEGREI